MMAKEIEIEIEKEKKITTKMNLTKNTDTEIMYALFNKVCYSIGNEIYLDFPQFKDVTKVYPIVPDNYTLVTQYFINVISKSLEKHPLFIIHFNVKSISLTDVEKNYRFIQHFSLIMKNAFPDKMDKCYIYNSPSIFKQIFAMISVFIDKKTRDKFFHL